MTTIGDKSFVDTLCFGIYYEGGAGGNFIRTLIYKYIYGSLDIKLSKNGNSHNEFHISIKNYEIHPPATYDNFDLIILETIDPIDKKRPIIYASHGFPSYEKFFSVFPIGKIIFINVPKNYKLMVLLNQFYKTIFENFNTNLFMRRLWTDHRKNYSFFKDIEDPTTLTPDEVRNLFSKIQPNTQSLEIPEKYAEKISVINYDDILNNKDKILEFLSNITEKPTTNEIVEFYDQYLLKQNQLIKTKMPWIVA